MAITPDQRARLDHLMNLRRLELGITWRDVASRAGLSYEALRRLRTGDGGIRDLTASKISRALEWTSGSVDAVLEGGDPVPAAAAPPAEDAIVTVLKRALLPGENILRESGLDPEFANDLIVALRNREVPELIVSLVENRRRARRSGS